MTPDQLRQLPKAEVHVHLEGCSSARELAVRAAASSTPLPRPVDSLFHVADFDDFLEFLTWSCGLFTTPQDLASATYAYAERAAASGVLVADVIVNPVHWPTWKGRLGRWLDALGYGIDAAIEDGLPPIGLCVSILRSQSADEACELVEQLAELRHPHVVALSVDGNEALAGRTGARFADAFAAAGRAGLRRTVHAGETSGPEGVRDAIELLGADRIDHGVRAVDDPALIAELADRGIPLGICPTSNLTLGICAALEEHPIERLRAAGVRVTLNTDDPGFLGIDLIGEYARCRDAFGWSDEVLRDLAATSLAACFTKSRR